MSNIMCRGRNGWFAFKEYAVCHGIIIPKRKRFGVSPTVHGDIVSVVLLSKAKSKTPPICIEGQIDEVEVILKGILKDVGRLKDENRSK